MRHIQLKLAAAVLVFASGGMPAAEANSASTTLYTAVFRAGEHNCNAVNVGDRTLELTISVLDQNGHVLAVTPPTPTAPGAEFSNSFGTYDQPIDAYCKFEVLGRASARDLRVVDSSVLICTFDFGSQTNIPVFVTRTVTGN